MLEIAGSLWSVPAGDQLDAAVRLRDRGLGRLHWDMSDGRFAASGGFSADRAAALTEATGLRAEAHLMVISALQEVDPWTEFCDLVIVHAETEDWPAAVDRILARGAEPGLAISPGTSVDVVPEGMAVLCMTIVPGTAGSTFDRDVLSKVAHLHRHGSHRVGVDGGMRRDLVTDVASAGADWAVVGTDLFLTDAPERWDNILRA